jgi:peptidoglycan/LPS O-acetylase OafA/YrhL
MKRLPIIEFLKGYSIFTIIIFHYLQHLKLGQPYSQFIFFGGTGVHLFILLSGFGLYLSYLHKPLPYWTYLKKRTSKIYFPYIAVVTLSAILSLIVPIYDNSLYAFGGHVFLYKMFDESIMGSYGYPLWFISTILQFYLVFYILVLLVKKMGDAAFLVFCLALSVGWTFLVLSIGKESERVWNSFFLRYVWEFALGMVIAETLVKNKYDLPFKISSAWLLVVGVVNCALYALLAMKGGAIGKLVNDIPALIGYSCIAVWIYQLGIGAIDRFGLFTGRISYPLYLLHSLILLLALQLRIFPLPAALLLALVITYAAAYGFQLLLTRQRRTTLSVTN